MIFCDKFIILVLVTINFTVKDKNRKYCITLQQIMPLSAEMCDFAYLLRDKEENRQKLNGFDVKYNI